MSQWEMVKLGEACEIVTGTTPKSGTAEYWNGTNNWVTPAELSETTCVVSETERKITDIAVKDSSLKPFPKGTVLFSSRAPIGKVAIAGTEMYCNQGFKNFVCSDSLFNKYLFWYLKSKKDYFNFIGKGATFKEISKSAIAEVQIPLPPLETQQHMAKTLDLATGIIEGYRQKLTELDKLVQSVFYEMFGDPVENEKGWEKIELLQVLHSIESGKSFVCNNEPRTGENPAILKLSAISSGVFVPKENKSMIDTNDFVEKREVNQGDLLFSRKNTPELVGISAFVIKSEAKLMLPDLIFRLITKDNCDKIYLWKLINHSLFRLEVTNLANGSSKSMCNISMENLKKLKIPLPPLQLQEQFAQIVENIEEEKALVKKGLHEAEQLFGGLLQGYFEN